MPPHTTQRQAQPVPVRGRPPRTTTADIVAAALVLVDTEGSDALSLRGLADHLDMAVRTLYKYVESKEQLVQEIVTCALAPVSVDRASGRPWREQVLTTLQELHRTLSEHPGAVELIALGTPLTTRGVDRLRTEMTALLRDSGMPRQRAIDTFHFLGAHVIGILTAEAARARHAQALEDHLNRGSSAGESAPDLTPAQWTRPIPHTMINAGLRYLIDGLSTDLP